MGSRGPLPKRSDERTRRHKTGEDGIEVKKGVAFEYEWTPANKDWPEPVKRFYNSFQESGMQAYYQQTDVEKLWLACDLFAAEYEKGPYKRSAMMLAEINKMWDGLGASEGERRRMKIELDAPQVEEVDAKVARIADAKSRLKNSKKPDS
jgi:hypothetical protein